MWKIKKITKIGNIYTYKSNYDNMKKKPFIQE